MNKLKFSYSYIRFILSFSIFKWATHEISHTLLHIRQTLSISENKFEKKIWNRKERNQAKKKKKKIIKARTDANIINSLKNICTNHRAKAFACTKTTKKKYFRLYCTLCCRDCHFLMFLSRLSIICCGSHNSRFYICLLNSLFVFLFLLNSFY